MSSALAATLALGLHPTQTVLLQHLLLRGGAANVSVATLASWAGVSEGTARTHLRLLQGAGWIEIEERYYATSAYSLTAKARRLGLEPEADLRPDTSAPKAGRAPEVDVKVDESTPTNFVGGGTNFEGGRGPKSEVGGGTKFVPNYSLASTITSPPPSVVLVRDGDPSAGRDLEGGGGGGDSDRAAPAGPAAWLPSHLRKPLEAQGIGSLEELSAYSRGGIAGLCPALASVPKLDALEGALRRAGLWWAGSGWGQDGPRLEVISGGKPPPEASTPPKTSSPPPPTSAPPKSTGEPCELGADWFSQEAYDAWQREAF